MVNLIEKMWAEPQLKENSNNFCGNLENLKSIHNISNDAEHLGTASIIIHGYVIDFASFRHEEYSPGSRVPSKIEPGSIEQDCMRRDFTVNSLYYDVLQKKVDDLSGNGIKDVNEGIIRMLKTTQIGLEEDPLRVARAFRFGAKYGFHIDKEILESSASDEVIKACEETVSRERLTKELKALFHAITMVKDIGSFFKDMIMLTYFEKIYSVLQYFENRKIQGNIESVFLWRRKQSMNLLSMISNSKDKMLQEIKEIFGDDEETIIRMSLCLFLSVWIVPYYFELANEESLESRLIENNEEIHLEPHKSKLFPFYMQTMRLDKNDSITSVKLFNAVASLGNIFYSQKDFIENNVITDQYLLAKFIKSIFYTNILIKKSIKKLESMY
jgi:tRNA nucleotidyltransferase/poly(A) polymerase